MNRIARPERLPHSRACRRAPPPPRIWYLATGRTGPSGVRSSVSLCSIGRRYGDAITPASAPTRNLTGRVRRAARSAASALRRRRVLAEPSEAGGRGGATHLPRHSQLRVDVRQVSLDRAHAEAEP